MGRVRKYPPKITSSEWNDLIDDYLSQTDTATQTLSSTLNIGADVNLYRSAADVLKTDDNLDALALRIGGIEVITSTRKLDNIANLATNLIPDSNTLFKIGQSGTSLSAVYAKDFYGTSHYSDVCFRDLTCPICGEAFKEGEILGLYVTKVEEEEIRTIPAHFSCLKSKKKKTRKRRRTKRKGGG